MSNNVSRALIIVHSYHDISRFCIVITLTLQFLTVTFKMAKTIGQRLKNKYFSSKTSTSKPLTRSKTLGLEPVINFYSI